MKITRSGIVALVVALAGCGSATTETKSAAGAASTPSTGGEGKSATVRGEEVQYQADGVTLRGYIAYDESKKGRRPGVLVVHEWWGHNEYARKRARMLAELGYTALAVDMFGDGKTANHPSEAKAFTEAVMTNKAIAMARLEAARKLLAAHAMTDATKVSAIGYCFGGGVVLHAARTGMKLDGVTSFHGSLGTDSPAQTGAVHARILVLTGKEDPMVSAEQVAAFRNEMKTAGANARVVEYEGAKHAFTNPDADSFAAKFSFPALAYNAEADRKSWDELKHFLAELYPTAK